MVVLREGNETKLDYWIRVSSGIIAKRSLVHKFGRNDAVPNNTWAFVNLLGFTAWPLSAATKVRIKAGGNVADVAGGAGALSVVVQGIDTNGDEIIETIATAGASASSLTTALFWRIHRAWVSGVGAYGVANTDDIVIENGTGGTDLIKIDAGEGQSQFAGFTIPANHTGYLLSLNITVDAVKPADIRLFTRNNITDVTSPMSSKRLKLYFDGILGSMPFKAFSPNITLDALTDIWVEARGVGAITEVSADFELALVRD